MAFGKCYKCAPTARACLLIAGMCNDHFNGIEVKRNDAPQVEKLKALAAKNKTLDAWFKDKIAKRPSHCENCNKTIVIPPDVTPKAAIAHILSKKLFKSVSKNDNNWLALCLACHQDFDFRGEEKTSQMPVAKTAKQRFETFKDLIAEEEKKHIPKYLL